MQDNQTLEARVARLERLLALVEKRLFGQAHESSQPVQSQPRPQTQPPSIEDPKPTTPKPDYYAQPPKPQSSISNAAFLDGMPRVQTTHRGSSEQMKAGQILGYAGVGCVLLAIVLLIRLSIESGWLTPERQLALAAMFGFTLIGLPFIRYFEDREYMSLLPAGGIVVLHLTVFGGVFLHDLLDPQMALILNSAIGILSLILLEKFEYAGYALLSIFGTYLGALCLKSGFPSRLIFAIFILMWNIIYCTYAIYLKQRNIILLTSYLAIGLVSLKVIGMSRGVQDYYNVAFIQFIQFVLFLVATTLYSTINKVALTRNEAWSFFPLAVFFYVLEYNLLEEIDPNYPTIFAVVFSGVLFGAYKYARLKALSAVESGQVTYTIVGVVLAHAFYFSKMTDEHRIFAGWAFILAGFIFRKQLLHEERFRGLAAVLMLLFAYSMMILFVGPSGVSKEMLIGSGFFYGILLLGSTYYSRKQKSNWLSQYDATSVILTTAHANMLLAIYRLKEFLDRSYIAPLWILYAFGLLFWGYAKGDRFQGKSAIGIIIFGLIQFLVVDFHRLGGVERIIALLVMGGLIFASGYVYRLIPEKPKDKVRVA